MAEQQKTKDTKPQIEAAVGEVLNGDALENAGNLISYLRENRMNPAWSAANVWKISYKSFTVCFLRVYGAADYHGLQAGTWHVIPFIGEYEAAALPGELKEIVWAHKHTCQNCGQCSSPIRRVFGKEYDYACEKSIVFTNPDADDVACIKKLINLRRNAIKDGKAKKHQYIAMKDRK